MPELERAEAEPKGHGRALRGLPVAGRPGQGGFPQDGDPGNPGRRVLQQGEALARDVGRDVDSQSRDVAPGPSEACHEARSDRVRRQRHDDRDGRRRPLGEGDRLVAPRHDRIDVQPDELRHQRRQPLDLAVGESVLEPEILPLDVAQPPEPVLERPQDPARSGLGFPTSRGRPDTPSHRLRLGGERRGEEAEEPRRDECAPVHY